MPPVRVRAPDGMILTVEAPEGATPDTIKSLAKTQHEKATSPLTVAPTPAPSPTKDAVGRAKEWLTREPPLGSRTMFGETDMPGRVVRAAGDLFLPGSIPEAARFAATLPIGGGMVTGPLMRTGAGALAGGVASAMQGHTPGEAGWEGAKEGLSQFAGELLPGALRFGLTQRAGQKALAGRATEIGQREISQGAAAKVREDKIAYDTAMDKAVGTLEKEGYDRAVAGRRKTEAATLREARAQYQDRSAATTRQHGEAEAARQATHQAAVASATARHAADVRAYEKDGATAIAEGFKSRVPAFRDFPSNESGLLNMVSGEGPARMSARFDAALKDVVTLGRGNKIELLASDAKTLDLRPTGLRQLDKNRPPVADVDAGQLAEALTGFWKKDHGVYRRGVAALDRADIGDPASRAEYRAGRALLDFAESSQMLKGQKFNPDAARAAFDRVKKLDTLRKRGQGDMFTGPVAEAVNRPAPELRLPADVAPLPTPVTPAFRRPAPPPEVTPPERRGLVTPPEVPALSPLSPTPEGVRTKTLPKMSWWTGASVAEIPFLIGAVATGHQHYSGYGLPAAVGGLAAGGLSGRTFVTKAPLTPATEMSLRLLPGMGAQEARRMMGEP